MVRDPVTVGPDLSLDRFMDQVFFPHRHTAYPVTEQGRAVGLLSFRAVARTSRVLWSRRQVREAMVPLEQALVVSPRAKLSEVLGDLIAREPRRALVCEEGRLTGLLSVTDAVRILEARGGRAPVPAQ